MKNVLWLYSVLKILSELEDCFSKKIIEVIEILIKFLMKLFMRL